MAAHQAPPSLGFSRQEHWSGLPFPSPMHKSEKWKMVIIMMYFSTVKWSEVKVTQLCLTLCDPVDYIVHGIFQARILEWVSSPFSMGSAQPRNWTGVSCTAGGFFISWATREAHYSVTKVTRSSKLEKRLRERDKKSVTIKAAETLSLMKKKKKRKAKTKNLTPSLPLSFL